MDKVAEILKTNSVVYKAWLDHCEYIGDVVESLDDFARANYPDDYKKASDDVPYTYANAKQRLDKNIEAKYMQKGKEGIHVKTAQ